MVATLEQLTVDALTLPPAERESLAEQLLASLEDEDAPLDDELMAVVKRRSRELAEGMPTIPADEFFANLRRKLHETP